MRGSMLRSSARWRLLGEAGLLFLIALAPRLYGVGLFLTADEKNWMGRGVNFLQAVQEFHFNETFQTTHPGIPTLWIVGLSARVISRLHQMPFTSEFLHTFTEGTQLAFVVLTSLLVAALYLALRRLAHPWIARIAALAIALDPFLIGYSKVVHVDALLALCTALSFLLFLVAMRERESPAFAGNPGREPTGGGEAGATAEQERSRASSGAVSPDNQAPRHGAPHPSALPSTALVWSGVAGAFAILSKLPGLILLPMAGLALFAEWQAWGREEVRERLRIFGQWISIMAATILLLWPGILWVPDPVGNVKTVRRDVEVAVSTSHNTSDADSIVLWHYPRTLLARATIPALIGVSMFLVMALLFRRSVLTSVSGMSYRTLLLFGAFVVLFTIGMTFGAKKGDRYLLPVFPILNILGVIGLAALVAQLRPRWSQVRIAAIVLALVGIPSLLELTALGPYALAYYNRLLLPNFSQELGWGEGLDQVARYVDSLDDNGKIAVASWYPEELRALLTQSRTVTHLSGRNNLRVGYVVLYRNMFGRPPDHPANDFIDEYYKKRTPVFIATVNGLPYAWVYQQPAYSSINGELTDTRQIVAELPVGPGTFSNAEAFIATYSGKADTGTFILRLRETLDGPDLRVSRLPIQGDADNAWVRFAFEPLVIRTSGTLIALLTTEGTSLGKAPTIRSAPYERHAPRFGIGDRSRSPREILTTHRAPGLLGVRILPQSP